VAILLEWNIKDGVVWLWMWMWIDLAENKDGWWAFLNKIINSGIP